MKYKVIIETDQKDRPKDHEISVAIVLAQHFQTDILFIRPGHQKTPDVDVNGVLWEIKSPMGNSKKTMENNLRSARKQSMNIIIDLNRTSMNYYKSLARINAYLKTQNHTIKRLKIVTKSLKIIDIL